MSYSKYLPSFSPLAFALALLGLAACSSAKYTGPSDEVIRQQVGDILKSDSAGSAPKLNIQITKIWHDEASESNGARGIPKGTVLFRIKCVTAVKEGTENPALVPLEVYFYRDGNGAWKSFTKE